MQGWTWILLKALFWTLWGPGALQAAQKRTILHLKLRSL